MTETSVATAARGRRWEQATDRPLMAEAVIFLVAYAVPILFLSAELWLLAVSRDLSWATWVVFVVDFIVRWSLAERRLP